MRVRTWPVIETSRVAALAAWVSMRYGANLDSVIVKATQVRAPEENLLEMVRVETHGGECRFIFVAQGRTVHPVSLLGRNLLEVVIDLYGPKELWHPHWCWCSACQDTERLERAYEAETNRQWDAWHS